MSDGALASIDQVQINVVTAQQGVATLEIAPRFVTLGSAETQAFTAIARNGAGAIVNATPAWSASVGYISSTGVYTSSQAGLHTITASAGGVFATASVDAKSSATIWPTGGWISATPAALGLDAAPLNQARDYALRGGGAGMIVRGGRQALAWGNLTTRYDVKSSTKSIAGTSLGLALNDGLVTTGDRARMHLSSFGTPPDSNLANGWLDDVTLLQLATHTAGFDKPGGYTSLLFEPGSRWSYSDSGMNWLADVLTQVYRADLRSLLFSRVLTPIGVASTDLTWRSNAYREDLLNGVKRREFASGVTVNANAMARIGYLYLRRGLWAGQRIVPDAFVQQVQQPAASVVGALVRDPVNFPNASNHYGVLWWTNADSTLPAVPRDAFWSWGLGDSLIIVIPSLDLVAVRAGAAWRSGAWTAQYAVIDPFITPIVQAVSSKIGVPQGVGKSQAAAAAAIAQAGLAVSGVLQQASMSTPAGVVISQTPSANTQVARNTGVSLVVSSGP